MLPTSTVAKLGVLSTPIAAEEEGEIKRRLRALGLMAVVRRRRCHLLKLEALKPS